MRQCTKKGKSTGKRLLSQNCLYYQFDSTFFVYIILQSSLFISLKQHNQLTTLLNKKKREREALSKQILQLDKEMNEIERVLKRHDY